MDQSCQKVLLVLTQLGIQTFTSSTLPTSFFPSRCQYQKLYTWSRLFVSTHLKIWYLHRSWNPNRPDVAKVILVLTYLVMPTRPRKLQLLIFVSGSELKLSYYYRTLTVKSLWFYSLHRLEFLHQDLHRKLFSLKNAFLFYNQLLYVQSIVPVPPWRKKTQCDCALCSFVFYNNIIYIMIILYSYYIILLLFIIFFIRLFGNRCDKSLVPFSTFLISQRLMPSICDAYSFWPLLQHSLVLQGNLQGSPAGIPNVWLQFFDAELVFFDV